MLPSAAKVRVTRMRRQVDGAAIVRDAEAVCANIRPGSRVLVPSLHQRAEAPMGAVSLLALQPTRTAEPLDVALTSSMLS